MGGKDDPRPTARLQIVHNLKNKHKLLTLPQHLARAVTAFNPNTVATCGIGGSIVVQLDSSQFIAPAFTGNTAFVVHQWVGLAATGLVGVTMLVHRALTNLV